MIKYRIILVLICIIVIALGAIIISQYANDDNNNNNNGTEAIAGQKQQSILQVQSKKMTIENYSHIVNTQLTTLQTPTISTTENLVSLT
ncbi:MAG: hypothetical protein ACJ71A_09745, partial [Nitrososphaeraceae archaeon]